MCILLAFGSVVVFASSFAVNSNAHFYLHSHGVTSLRLPEAFGATNSLIPAGKPPLDPTAFGTSGVSTLPRRVSLTTGSKQQQAASGATPASPGAFVTLTLDRTTAKLVRLGSGDPSLASSTSHLPVLQHRADSKTDLRQAVASSPAHRQRPELHGPPSPTHRTEMHNPASAHAKGDPHQHSAQSAHPRTGAQQAPSKRDSWKELVHEADEQPALSPSVRARTSFLNRQSSRESTGADASTAFPPPRAVRRVMPASSAEKTGTNAGGGMGFGSLRKADRPNSGLASNYNQRASRESLVQSAAAATPKTAPRTPLQSSAAAAPVALAHEELAFVDEESPNESSEPERSSRTPPQQQSQFRFPTSYAVPFDALAKYRLPSGSQTTNESTIAASRNSGILSLVFWYSHHLSLPYIFLFAKGAYTT